VSPETTRAGHLARPLHRMKVFWFFFSKKNRKRFFLKKEAKTFIPFD
jgi:hypothetical protein